jgi:hypothetical protein
MSEERDTELASLGQKLAKAKAKEALMTLLPVMLKIWMLANVQFLLTNCIYRKVHARMVFSPVSKQLFLHRKGTCIYFFHMSKPLPIMLGKVPGDASRARME